MMLSAKTRVITLLLLCWPIFISLRTGNTNDQAVQIFKGPVGEFGPLCSPDGRWLAFEYFTSKNIGDTEIWIMSNSSKAGDVTALLNQKTLEYGEIAWSPDSASLSFIGNRPVNSRAMTEQVFSVNVQTREVKQLTHLPEFTALGAGTSWSKTGQIAFVMNDDIYVVSESGGNTAKLVNIHSLLAGVTPYFPLWSPDASRLAFVGRKRENTKMRQDLYVIEIGTGKLSKIFEAVGDDSPFWFDDRYLLSSHEDGKYKYSIWLVPILKGNPKELTHGFYDGTPSVDPSKSNLFFSRSENIREASLDSPARGFHLWKQKLRSSR